MLFPKGITRFLCALVSCALWAGCAAIRPDRTVPRPQVKTVNVPILLYHHVQDLPADAGFAKRRWSLAPQKFTEHLEWIAGQGFQPVTMEHLIGHMKHGRPLPSKPIIITFDDGWKDNYSTAFPILKKYGFTATFFIITDSVGHSAYMNWEQIEGMSAAGMDIQSHSMTHPRLSTLPLEDARAEVAGAKEVLERHIRKPVNVLAYPYGSYDDDLIEAVKAAGYEGAAIYSGLNGGYLFRADQSYVLLRYAIEWDENLAGIARLKGF